ncbi:MAG: type III-B CRISPR module RAMP protein Cmr4 [Anaerolineae bacterium]
MFDAKSLMFIYVETPLHVGAARSLGTVDLPIQRERSTGYPMVQASSLKGALRAETHGRLSQEDEFVIFGPETAQASDHAGALSVGDARILLFPVRSLSGVFAWTTSLDVLARFQRDAVRAGQDLGWALPTASPGTDEAWVNSATLLAGDSVVLEEFSFKPNRDQQKLVQTIGAWLADHALRPEREYDYWRSALPARLCILPEDAFRDFVLYSTEVQTHIKLNPNTKTVDNGALWTSESLPVDTLLYAPLMATPARRPNVELSGLQILQKLEGLNLARLQVGGDETTGQGITAIRMTGGVA